jgi:hypothetical protein
MLLECEGEAEWIVVANPTAQTSYKYSNQTCEDKLFEAKDFNRIELSCKASSYWISIAATPRWCWISGLNAKLNKIESKFNKVKTAWP